MTFVIKTRGASRDLLQDFECPTHGLFDQLAPPDTAAVPCPACGAAAEWRISAPAGRVRMVEASRGVADKPRALDLSTRDLAEGMPLSEWRARRARAWQEHDHKINKEVRRGY